LAESTLAEDGERVEVEKEEVHTRDHRAGEHEFVAWFFKLWVEENTDVD
jgi:hypothetical protein